MKTKVKDSKDLKKQSRKDLIVIIAIFAVMLLIPVLSIAAVSIKENQRQEALKQAELKSQQDKTARELQELKDKQVLETQSTTAPPAPQNQTSNTTQAPQKTPTQSAPKTTTNCAAQGSEFEKIVRDYNNSTYAIYLAEKQRISTAAYAANEEWLRESDINKAYTRYEFGVNDRYLNAKSALEGMGCSTSGLKLLYWQPK